MFLVAVLGTWGQFAVEWEHLADEQARMSDIHSACRIEQLAVTHSVMLVWMASLGQIHAGVWSFAQAECPMSAFTRQLICLWCQRLVLVHRMDRQPGSQRTAHVGSSWSASVRARPAAAGCITTAKSARAGPRIPLMSGDGRRATRTCPPAEERRIVALTRRLCVGWDQAEPGSSHLGQFDVGGRETVEGSAGVRPQPYIAWLKDLQTAPVAMVVRLELSGCHGFPGESRISRKAGVGRAPTVWAPSWTLFRRGSIPNPSTSPRAPPATSGLLPKTTGVPAGPVQR